MEVMKWETEQKLKWILISFASPFVTYGTKPPKDVKFEKKKKKKKRKERIFIKARNFASIGFFQQSSPFAKRQGLWKII